MSQSHTLFSFSEGQPVAIETCRYRTPQKHLHDDAELVFVLDGEASVLINDRPSRFVQEDVCLFSPHQPHEILSADCTVLSLRFNMQELMRGDRLANAEFTLNSAGETASPRYDYVRHLIAQLVKVNASGEHRYKTLSLLYMLIGHLIENFRGMRTPARLLRGHQQERMSAITGYISAHSSEGLTLGEVAEAQNLSAAYLSAFFERNMGMTFLTYYNQVRLGRAVYDMLSGSETLERIALNSGFRDVRSFVALFKRKYGCLPSVYRRQHRESLAAAPEAAREETVSAGGEWQSLARYLHMPGQDVRPQLAAEAGNLIIDGGSVSFAAAGKPLRHRERRMCCVGSARQLLFADVQDMLRAVQQELGYEYVKFHGILSDELMVYAETENGAPVISFTMVDKVLDFLLSVQLRPLVQLSFMPLALASDPDKTIDRGQFNTSPPKDMKKWFLLVKSFTQHLISRYGAAEVRRWPFCVWNEPDGSVSSFGWPDREQFFAFYDATCRCVKSVDEHIAFGSPSLIVCLNAEDSWAADFFRYCNSHRTPMDFVNVHYYDNSFFDTEQNTSEFSLVNLQKACPLNADPFAFTKFINGLKARLERYRMEALPIYLTEWNLTVSHRDLINDTCFKACYLIKNILENYDRLDSYGYWCLTDLIEELQLPGELYHGGLGMLTYNGIPKAHYNAFRFLWRLDDIFLASGSGYFITRSDRRVTAVLYNYEHYSKLFASGILFDMSSENRYAPFTQMNKATFRLRLTNLPAEGCLVKEVFVNQRRGSSYDAWVRMGSQPLTQREDMELLRREAQPGMYLHRHTLKGGVLNLEIELEPLEVRLVIVDLDG